MPSSVARSSASASASQRIKIAFLSSRESPGATRTSFGARNTEAGSSLAWSRSIPVMAGFASSALGDSRLWLGGFVHAEHLAQTVARAVDAALDRADGAAGNLRGFLVGEARSSNQDQGFALVVRQLGQSGTKILHLHMAVLLGMGGKRCGVAPVRVLDLAAAFAALGEIGVAQDGEQPCLEVSPFAERVEMVPGLEQGLLHKVVGTLPVAAKRHGKRAKIGHLAYEGVSQALRHSASQITCLRFARGLSEAEANDRGSALAQPHRRRPANGGRYGPANWATNPPLWR